MKLFSNLLARSAASFMIFGASVAMAQDAGPYSRANVSQSAPFGTIVVDPTDLSVNAAYLTIADLTPTELTELNQRCAAISAGQFYYGVSNAGFCERILLEQGIIEIDFGSSDTGIDPNVVVDDDPNTTPE